MIGLLRKDLLLIAKRYKTSLLFLLIAALPAIRRERVDLIFGAYLFASMLVIQSDLITVDDDAKSWRKMEESLPVSAYQIVLEKYVAALLFLLVGGAIFLLCSVVEKMNVGKSWWLAFPSVAVVLAACCVSLSLQIPVLYRFGKRVGIPVFLLLGAAACVVIVGIRWWGWGDSNFFSPIFSAPISYLLIVGTVGLTVLSWLLSTHIYRRKER